MAAILLRSIWDILPVIAAVSAMVVARDVGCRVLSTQEGDEAKRYPALAISAILGLIATAQLSGEASISSAIFVGGLCAASVIDLAAYRLPDRLTLPLFIFASIWGPVSPDMRIVGACAAAALLWAARAGFWRLRSIEGLGFGDVKLAAACGAWVGVLHIGPLLIAAGVSALLAAAFRQILRSQTGAPPRSTSAIAFGPHLALATLIIAFLTDARVVV